MSGQLLRGYGVLEKETPAGWFGGAMPNQADITIAVAWRFTQSRFPEVVSDAAHPKLAAHSARAEKLAGLCRIRFLAFARLRRRSTLSWMSARWRKPSLS